MKCSSEEGLISVFYNFSHKKIVYWLFFLKIAFFCRHPVCYERNIDNSLNPNTLIICNNREHSNSAMLRVNMYIFNLI